MRKLAAQGWVSRSTMSCIAVLLSALPGICLGAEHVTRTVITPAEMAKQATQQSADKHRIEILKDGRVLVPSPLQAIEATATPEGITVVSTAKDEPGTFAIRPASLGRAGDKGTALLQGKVSIDGQLARIARPGLVEELTTSADGVRQDFVIAAAPPGKGDLVLELEVTGALLGRSGDAARFTLESGRELLYHRLLVTDSRGKSLNARFEVEDGGRLRIIVADAIALYPIRIDPTIVSPQWNSIAQPDTDNIVRTLVWDGTYLYAGGDFTTIGGIFANRIARWNGSTWSPLGSGMNNTVQALAWDGTGLYAGGLFTTAGGTTVNYIAKWDGSTWLPVGNGGMNDRVYALVWNGTVLYAGGYFTNAGGVAANNIAKWNGSTWAPLGSGTNYNVQSLACYGSTLYVGGNFTTAGGMTANRIAKWNGSAWSSLGSGMNSTVYAFAWDGSGLYAGGYFSTAGGVTTGAVARWNGSTWSAVGSGMINVYALAWDGTTLYAGGNFGVENGPGLNYIAKWDGSTWSRLDSGMNDYVYALAWDGTSLYAGGKFISAGGQGASRIAKWNGSTWSPFGSGMNGSISAFVWDGTFLYAGGGFRTAGGKAVNFIAKWDGSTWSPLGSGMFSSVSALAWDGTFLYAGGNFFTAGGTTVNYIAKWNGSAWSPLGSGMNSSVTALAWDGTFIYAGGNFTTAGGTTVNYIAKWNGSTWSPLGSGMNNSVTALAWDGTFLYAGGIFTTSGGAAASRIAKWDGSTWSPLGSGVNNQVNALASDGTFLYAGGYFSTAGGSAVTYIARWDGSSWLPLGSGMNNYVFALTCDGTRLYAGGSFTTAGGISAVSIAAWDGSSWASLGGGMTSLVSAFGWDGTNLYANGNFTTAGGAAARAGYATLKHKVTATAGANGTVSPTNTNVYDGTSTDITITPNTGFTIADVTGCGGSLSGTIYTTGPVTADCIVTASFTTIMHTLIVTVTGAGTVHTSSGTDMACTGNCGQGYDEGTVVSLTPNPGTGYTFTGWSGDCSGTGACSVTMDQARSVVATFGDITPPDTIIILSPPISTTSTSFTFAFSATEAGSTFECKLGSGNWGDCASPYSDSIVYAQCTSCRSESQVSFAVRAKDPAGNTDPIPATWNWTISQPISSPIGNVQDSGVVQLSAADFTGDLTFSRAIAFTMKGGYAADYSAQTGVTTIRGTVTIAAGTVTMENIAIAP